MFDLEQAIRERHSTRLFLPQPVPRALVDEALVLAQHAPSNSDIQPWHMVFASGPPRDRLVKALLEEAQRRPPNISPLPEAFRHYRRELGAQVYGAMGRKMTLDAHEFLRRFLQHVLPPGFQNVRHYGFLSPRSGIVPEAVWWLITVVLGAIFTLKAASAGGPAQRPMPRCP